MLGTAVLQYVEQPGLGPERQVFDLGKENRPSQCLLHEALLVLFILPAMAAKEPTREIRLANGIAVDANQRAGGAPALPVDRPCQRCLFRPRLAADQHGGQRRGDLGQQSADRAHRRALRHDRIVRLGVGRDRRGRAGKLRATPPGRRKDADAPSPAPTPSGWSEPRTASSGNRKRQAAALRCTNRP